MDTELEETSLWHTKAQDMTIGDAMKLNGIVLAATAGLIVTFGGVVVAADKFHAWRETRKIEKDLKEASK